MSETIKLTQYSHGAGCGCKIAPALLERMLHSNLSFAEDKNLLVGNDSRDDAAAYDMGNGTVVLSTTDFFMPIVDDPFDFGRIAATNAISDIYAMGGTPIMAIAILGWPVDKLAPEVAQQVIDGGRQACADAGITLAGGHSIDSPEPIFGLAVTGQVSKQNLKQNNQAQAGCQLFLTKPLGIGILSTAQKQQKVQPQHQVLARDLMCQLNTIGSDLAKIKGVQALTDVTGFGLLGHLLEVCRGSAVHARLNFSQIPLIEGVEEYLALGCIPGGSTRNFESYGDNVGPMTLLQQQLLCDPQTSGGLLIAVQDDSREEVAALLAKQGLYHQIIGELVAPTTNAAAITIV